MFTINEAHKRYSPLYTIFDYIFYFGPPGKHLENSQENLLCFGRLHVVGFEGFSIDVSLRSKITNIVKSCTSKLYCLWASVMA